MSIEGEVEEAAAAAGEDVEGPGRGMAEVRYGLLINGGRGCCCGGGGC